MASAEEDAILRKRILTQTTISSKGLAPFSKLVKTYTQFCQAVEQGSLDDAVKLHSELLVELHGLNGHLRRLDASAAAFKKEQAFYDREQEQLQAAISQATNDIEQRKSELEAARQQLAQEQEYESIKQQVVKVPARSVTRKEMSAVEKEITDLQQQSVDLETLMQRRKMQFAAIVHCIEQINTTIDAAGEQDGGTTDVDMNGGEVGANNMQVD